MLSLGAGLKDQPSPLCARQFLVGDLCASSRKLRTLISARQAAVPAVPPCLELGRERQETGGSSMKSLAGSVPHGTWHPLGSGIMVGLLCLCGICKHRDGVKTGPTTKAVCQLPCSEGRPPFPCGFLSLQISVPANDFPGHVMLT